LGKGDWGFAKEATEEAEAPKSLSVLEGKMYKLIKFTRTSPNLLNSFR